MVVLKNQILLFGGDDFQESLFKVNSTDCILYSEDGTQFAVHKEILCQTPFLQRILFSAENTCCGKIEIFCPCTTNDLEYIVKFLYSGKISIENKIDTEKILDDLHRIFGFPEKLCFSNGKNQIIDSRADASMYVGSSKNEEFLKELNLTKKDNQNKKAAIEKRRNKSILDTMKSVFPKTKMDTSKDFTNNNSILEKLKSNKQITFEREISVKHKHSEFEVTENETLKIENQMEEFVIDVDPLYISDLRCVKFLISFSLFSNRCYVQPQR